ncbi:MAG: neutral/alkaline ceramidase [bacterium]|nr:neutral/alkaline ceramidase [bacterium]
MQLKKFLVMLAIFTVFISCDSVPNNSGSASTEGSSNYMLGAGIYDITLAPAEVMFVGYVNTSQKGEGIKMRQFSRAFIIKDTRNNNSVVMVNADIGTMSQGVQLYVINKLKEKYGDLYTEKNVLLSATHTHSGPGGYFFEWAINAVMGLGFCEKNFEILVNGIVESIERAHNNLTPGKIYLNSGKFSSETNSRISRQRSPEAYVLNPASERSSYLNEDGTEEDTNRRMSLLKFTADNGSDIGIYSWAPIHPNVSGANLNLVNGDIIGYTEYLLEKGKSDLSETSYVAAMGMSDCGDTSGNLPEDAAYFGASLNSKGDYPALGDHDYERVKLRAETAFALADSLNSNALTELSGTVEYRQMFVDFKNFSISSEYIEPHQVMYSGVDPVYEDINNCRLCTGTVGLALTAGSTEDGDSGLIENEGCSRDVSENNDYGDCLTGSLPGALDILLGLTLGADDAQDERNCQLEKVPFLAFDSGTVILPGEDAWATKHAIQIIKIGSFAIVGLPFEVSTMAGRRIRAELKTVLPDVTHVEIAALSGSDCRYLTTREEYASQQYEGGSNVFGPYTLNGIREMVNDLANTFDSSIALPSYALGIDSIEDRLSEQVIIVGNVILDDKPPFKSWGTVKSQPDSSYNRTNAPVASAVFWGAHPNNDVRHMKSFLAVEKLSASNEWETIATDNDPETEYRWNRNSVSYSLITISWAIPESAEAGTYRLRHYGNWKSGWTGNISEYTGVSNSFTVQ